MCRYNLAVDDTLMEEVRPHIDENVAVQTWLEDMLRKALVSYVEQMTHEKNMDRERKRLLERVKEMDASPGFSKLGGILGKPNPDFSWDELRDEAISEKYGV